MSSHAQSVTEFYASRQGAMAARLLGERLARFWPSLPRQSVLGIGYAAPYFGLWSGEAERCVCIVPPQIGVARWPASGPNLACAADDDALPFPDLSFDRILLVHGLEAAENNRRMLREAWRVLREDGRLLVVAPNRRGMWAHIESTPFGQGQPYSPGQIGRLLTASLFRIVRRDTALYVPPTDLRVVLRGAAAWERIGRAVAPRFAGVTLTEAAKDVYGAMPVATARSAARRGRVVFAEPA